jgi:hypothetical protein
MPPPATKFVPGAIDPVPPVTVNPSRIAAAGSNVTNFTAEEFLPVASIVVTAAPPTPATRIDLLMKLIASK